MSRTLLVGGRVYAGTGPHLGGPGEPGAPDAPAATAMAVDGGTVAWAGPDEGAAAYADGADEVVHLEGALVTPAFVDAHVHATSTGLVLDGLDLAGAPSLAGMLDRLAAHALRHPAGPLLGHGWDETRWPEGRPPTAADLDRAAPGRVVYLSRVDVHSAVASPALLADAPEAAGAGGFAADGRVSQDAHHAVRRVAYGMVTADQRRAAQRATLRRAAALGIGCVHELAGPDISGADDLAGLLDLAVSEPGPDVLGYWGELGGAERARELGTLGAAGDLFADGAIGSRTACLRAVYADAPTCGAGYLTAAQVRDHVAACTEAGLQAGFHAIGDAALDAVVAGFEEAAGRVGPDRLRAARHRVEHVEMLDADLVARLARLGVVASVQPAFDAAWGGTSGMYAHRLGVDRALTLNPLAAMAAAGIPLAFGSDSPVTPLDPWGTVAAATSHHVPAQRLDTETAFAAHTRGGWYAAGGRDASGREGRAGRTGRAGTGGMLVPGAPATYAVWRLPDGHAARATGLPDPGPGDPAPTCQRTVVRGTTVYTPSTSRLHGEGKLP